ncbi:uncharacterized protein LOC142047381 [Chelonoidis abingdonii]|uniref:uncharacterized protein LOC142047381 n=1 Tax=Chelonoidis abingdonii TaxID=106734 RepID=UPI003F495C65
MSGSLGFKPWSTCQRPMPMGDPHDSCLRCLGESHQAVKCRICKAFMPRTRKERDFRLKQLLMEVALSLITSSARQDSAPLSSVWSALAAPTGLALRLDSTKDSWCQISPAPPPPRRRSLFPSQKKKQPKQMLATSYLVSSTAAITSCTAVGVHRTNIGSCTTRAVEAGARKVPGTHCVRAETTLHAGDLFNGTGLDRAHRANSCAASSTSGTDAAVERRAVCYATTVAKRRMTPVPIPILILALFSFSASVVLTTPLWLTEIRIVLLPVLIGLPALLLVPVKAALNPEPISTQISLESAIKIQIRHRWTSRYHSASRHWSPAPYSTRVLGTGAYSTALAISLHLYVVVLARWLPRPGPGQRRYRPVARRRPGTGPRTPTVIFLDPLDILSGSFGGFPFHAFRAPSTVGHCLSCQRL